MGNSGSKEAAIPEVEEGDAPLSARKETEQLQKKKKDATTTTEDDDNDELENVATKIAQEDKEGKHKPSWQSSVSGGIARSFAVSLCLAEFVIVTLSSSLPSHVATITHATHATRTPHTVFTPHCRSQH